MVTSGNRFIERQYYKVRDWIRTGVLESRYVNTRVNCADITVVLEITQNPKTRFDRKNSPELLLWAQKRRQRQLGIILWEGQFLKKGQF